MQDWGTVKDKTLDGDLDDLHIENNDSDDDIPAAVSGANRDLDEKEEQNERLPELLFDEEELQLDEDDLDMNDILARVSRQLGTDTGSEDMNSLPPRAFAEIQV